MMGKQQVKASRGVINHWAKVKRQLCQTTVFLSGIAFSINYAQGETVEWLNDSFDGSISSSWIISGTDTDSTATVNAIESPFSSGTGSLTLDDDSITTEVNLRYTLPEGESIVAGESLTVEFDYYVVDAKLPILQIQKDTANAARVSLLGSFNNRLDGSWETLTTTSTGTWYRFSYTYHNNEVTDSADISLMEHGQSAQTWTGRTVESSQGSINSLLLQFNVNSTTAAKEWMIDNVKVTETRPDPDWFDLLQTTRLESDPNLVWEQFGPGMSGNNYRIYWHPTDANTVFLGPNMGMAYRSTDKGETYEGILDYDGQSYKLGHRGPVEIGSPDFSRQDANLGFCTGEDATFIYKTTDKGKTWERHTQSESVWNGVELNAITVDPADDDIWYVGSGNIKELNKWTFTLAEPHGSGAEANHVAKIWKTVDQGENWSDITPSGIDSAAQIQRIIVHPGNSSIIFAATTYGFYRSDDGGANWSLKISGLSRGIIRSFDMHYDSGQATLYVIDQVHWKSIESDPMGNPGVFDTVENDGGGIFKSTDNGDTWSPINGDISLDISELKSDYTFKTGYWSALDKWFGTNDAKTVYNSVYPTELMHNVSVVRVDPNNPDKLFVLNDYKHWGAYGTFKGGMLWRTDNGGSHWFITLRNGTAWDLVDGVEDSGSHKAYWEGRGNPTVHNMELRGQHEWTQRDSYERKAGGSLEFNADSSVIMFQWAKVLCISTDGGDTWTETDDVEATDGSYNYVSAGNSNLPGHGFEQDPRHPNKMFCMAGENDYWVSSDDGWNVRSSAFAARRNSLGDGEFSCSDIAFHPNDKDTIYSLQFRQASAGKLLKSTDGGSSFVEIGDAMPWPDGVSTNDTLHQLCLLIEPSNPENMYFCVPKTADKLAYVGNGEAVEYGIRKSTDGGLTWSWSNTGMPNDDTVGPDVSGLTLDPNDDSKLYACVYGSSGGLYLSEDHGTTWTKHTGLPSNIVSVQDLHFSSDGKMYVSCGVFNGDVADGGLWMSDDNGSTWTQLFRTVWGRMAKTAVYDPDVILFQVNGYKTETHMNPGTYLSKDGGATWTKVNNGNPQSDRVNEIAIDQNTPDVYYVSTWGCGWHRGTLKNPALTEGYNLVSLATISGDAQPSTTFDAILPSIDFVRDITDLAFSFNGSSWDNGLGDLEAYKGYLIKANESAELTVFDTDSVKPTSLNLIQGENLVPVIGRGPVLPLVYFSDIEDEIVYIRDEKGNTMRKINDNWVNNIGYLIGGKSYVVKMTQAGTLSIH